MKHRFSQSQKLLQKMALTSKMKHSIQMLGMSVKDLSEYIDTVISSNPLLQKKSAEGKEHSFARERSNAREYNDNIKSEEEIDQRQWLLSQVMSFNLGEKDSKIAEYLIYEMTDDGYIKVGMEEAASDLLRISGM